ncbi:uncharacterized protein LOC116181499 [Photinus pyralis]|nr:uncharacterized protein LOC116181499 [Photinus pyralis]
MCKILIDAGANINPVLRTSKNSLMTPMDCALQRGFRSTAKYLQLHGGVPANRLTGPSQGPAISSAISLQIRDDVTLWGGTSSEGESEDTKQKKKKKMYKRKLDYKFEKKKEPISLSDLEPTKLCELNSAHSVEKSNTVERKDATTSIDNDNPHQSEIIIYANEVNINEKLGDIKIERTNEISTERGKINLNYTKRNSSSSERRPKSAKYGRLRKNKKSIDTNEVEQQVGEEEFTGKKDAESDISEKRMQVIEDHNERTHEDDVEKCNNVAPLEMAPEAALACQSNGQSARSNTSLEDDDGHKEMVVEVSVHSPPKTPQFDTKQAIPSNVQNGETKGDEGNVAHEVIVDLPSTNDVPKDVQIKQDRIDIKHEPEEDISPTAINGGDAISIADTKVNGSKEPTTTPDSGNVLKTIEASPSQQLSDNNAKDECMNEESALTNNQVEDNSLANQIDVTIKSKNNGAQDSHGKKSDVDTHTVELETQTGAHDLTPVGFPNSKPRERSTDTLSDEESSSSTINTKQHKSFTVLNDDEYAHVPEVKASSESGSPKKFSQHERLRRSKIPTPISNLKSPLSKSDRYLERSKQDRTGIDIRVPSLPNIYTAKGMELKETRPVSNISAPIASTYSDNDKETGSDGDEMGSANRRKKLRKRSKGRNAKSAGSDYDSNLIDSGFEPSPRSTRLPKSKHMTERGVNMTSVTQTIQSNIRRYHLERKIFQHLLDLKRLQIRSGQHNEAVLVKRAIDAYHRSCAATVGAGRYLSQDYTFKQFENFLYNSLRKIQKNGSEHLNGLPETPRNPLHCTQSTHRCDHATHAYTGVPCAAYLPRMNHHNIPKIGFECKPSNFLPKIASKNAVTLELCHGNDKQVISLPAERLDQNKRYYVTFTVKGSDEKSSNDSVPNSHLHSKSD